MKDGLLPCILRSFASRFTAVEKVISENGLDAQLSKVDDIIEMMSYNIMSTPAVVVDGVVKIKGYVPTEAEVKKALGI